MTREEVQELLSEFLTKIDEFNSLHCPSFLTPNSYSVGIIPGHNLDLLQILFDFKVDRSAIPYAETPDELKDPSQADLKVIK